MNNHEARKLVVRDGLVTVRELAEAIELDRSNVFKDLKRRGIATEKRRSAEARGSFVSVLTRADAERYLDLRRSESLGSGGEIAYIEKD